jgi:aquaporin Z
MPIDPAGVAHRIATASATERPPGATPDRPLSGDPHPYDRLHPPMYASELVGTFLLVAIGLSIVIALWGTGAPLADLPIAPGTRRLLNGFLFGSVGAAIAYSPIGKISGAHINPAMTFAFWLQGKLQWRDASFYVASQLAGAALGAALLLAWGNVGASDGWAASVPNKSLPLVYAIGGEALCTFSLVALVFFCASHHATQPYTPLVNPPLFAVLTWLEAPVSGASANPARSFGPELLGGAWAGWWIYWVGPLAGAGLAVGMVQLGLIGRHRPHQARLFHFGHPGGTAPEPPSRP